MTLNIDSVKHKFDLFCKVYSGMSEQIKKNDKLNIVDVYDNKFFTDLFIALNCIDSVLLSVLHLDEEDFN